MTTKLMGKREAMKTWSKQWIVQVKITDPEGGEILIQGPVLQNEARAIVQIMHHRGLEPAREAT